MPKNKRDLLTNHAMHHFPCLPPHHYELMLIRHYRHVFRCVYPIKMTDPEYALLNKKQSQQSATQNRLAASADVTTGGRGYLDCGVVISPRGGSAGADLGVKAPVWHVERALSARCLNK